MKGQKHARKMKYDVFKKKKEKDEKKTKEENAPPPVRQKKKLVIAKTADMSDMRVCGIDCALWPK